MSYLYTKKEILKNYGSLVLHDQTNDIIVTVDKFGDLNLFPASKKKTDAKYTSSSSMGQGIGSLPYNKWSKKKLLIEAKKMIKDYLYGIEYSSKIRVININEIHISVKDPNKKPTKKEVFAGIRKAMKDGHLWYEVSKLKARK